MSQGMANSVVLATPIFFTVNNPTPNVSMVEILGLCLWGAFWMLESLADFQKMMFLQDCVKAGKKAKNAQEKKKLKSAVLGYAPFDGPRYWLWTKSRHPNYLFELLVWCTYSIMAAPSVMDASARAP